MESELVTIASFASYLEARIAFGYLQSSGVRVFLADEETGRIANHLTPMTGGIRLQVAREDLTSAHALLTRIDR